MPTALPLFEPTGSQPHAAPAVAAFPLAPSASCAPPWAPTSSSLWFSSFLFTSSLWVGRNCAGWLSYLCTLRAATPSRVLLRPQVPPTLQAAEGFDHLLA